MAVFAAAVATGDIIKYQSFVYGSFVWEIHVRYNKYIYTEGYSESTEPIDAENILPLAKFEPTTSATPPSTTPDTDATNCTTESSPKKGCSGSADIDDD